MLGISNSETGAGYGINVSSATNGSGYGVYSALTTTGNTGYGVYATNATTTAGYGVYSRMTVVGNTGYAGYFANTDTGQSNYALYAVTSSWAGLCRIFRRTTSAPGASAIGANGYVNVNGGIDATQTLTTADLYNAYSVNE